MAAARTAKQRAASRMNLKKARAATAGRKATKSSVRHGLYTKGADFGRNGYSGSGPIRMSGT